MKHVKKIIIALVVVIMALILINPDMGNSLLEKLGMGTSYEVVEGE